MAKISRIHVAGCDEKSCSCPWRLDFRPQGLAGPRKRLEFPTKRAAEKHLAATSERVTRGEYVVPERIPTFAALADSWLKEKAGYHPATIGGWRRHIEHLKPLASVRLDRIDVSMIERVRDGLLDGSGMAPSGRGDHVKALGARTVGGIMTTLTSVLKLAQRRKLITSNPAALAQRPRRTVVELRDGDHGETDGAVRALRPDEVLSQGEIAQLLEAAASGLYKTLFATAAATGLRSEEAYALRWSDLELGDVGNLYVRQSVSWARGVVETGRVRPKFFPPKTQAGYRTLPLPAALVGLLKVWKLQCPQSEHDLVFCRQDGQPLQRYEVLGYGLRPALRRAKLRRANMKTLRHSFASGLIAAGAPITEVQHRMGHSNPSVTLKVYSHWFKDADTGAAERFSAGFLKAASAHSVPTSTSTGITERDTKPLKMLRK